MRRGKYLSLILFQVLVMLVPFATSLPASIVHQEPEPIPLRNGPPDGSDFARMAADAAAAVSEQEIIAVDRSAQLERAQSSAEVDTFLGALVPEKNQVLPLAGKQTNLMVAGTVDGQVHALNPDTGELRWSFSTGEPLVKSYQQLPGTLDEKWWLIPMLDGSMLVKTAQGLRRPGLNARLLVDQTPFLAPGGTTFFTGSKVSRIFGVDALTGEVRQVLSGDTADSLASDRRLLARSGSDDDVIWIGRTDYTVRAFDVPTGQEQWNLTVGEFVSLDGLKLAAGSNGNNGGSNGGRKSGIRSATAFHDEATPSLLASPDGSLRRKASPVRAGKTTPHGNFGDLDEWKAPLPAQVASVFRVVLEEGSDHTYLPMQPMPLVQSTGDGISSGDAGVAAVGMLENDQLYAVMLDEEVSVGNVDESGSAVPVGTRAGKKNRPGEGKMTGGRVTATQPLLPHGDGKRDGGDGTDLGLGGGLDGSGHGISGPLVQCLSPKGSSTKGSSSHAASSAPPRSCQPGHPTFPKCLVGVHTVQIASEDQVRHSLGVGSQTGHARDGGAGSWDRVRTNTGYLPRLPHSVGSGATPGRASPTHTSGLAGLMGELGIGIGGHDDHLLPAPAPQRPLHALLNWLYRGWSIVSLGILAVVVMIIVDSRRAVKLFRQVGLRGYPFHVEGFAAVGGEYDPAADSGFSGASEASAPTVGAGSAAVGVSGVKGELRVGCLTVSDTVLGYGSHGTVVYRGLLEGRPVAVKRMLTDFHARADREISLLIESDGHPNVVRYFVREEAGEFVYLALQLCQLSLHNAMAQIHSTMAQARKRAERDAEGKVSPAHVGLGRVLTRDDVTAPPGLRAALLQVSQGVEHLHSLRIVHRDLKPHNILLAAKERKGQGLGRKAVDSGTEARGGEGVGEGEDGPEEPRKLSSMADMARFVLKISDMGLGKQLLNGQSSFGMSSYGRVPGGREHGQAGDPLPRSRESNVPSSSSAGGHVGSIGWQAPEVIADRVSLEGGALVSPAAGGGDESALLSNGSSSEPRPSWVTAAGGGQSSSLSTSSRRTQAVDVFSLGCVFHHCIVPGSHPFGHWYEREANIIQNKPSHLEELAHIPDAHDLVSLMTAREPDVRPSAREVCKHPFFWNEERRLSFLLEFSDRLEQDTVQSPLLVMVEAGARSVVGRSWDTRLDPELTQDAGRYRKYDFSSVRDLLRVVRNKRHHFHELPERVQGLMSPVPGGFLRYVEERFPQLLMHCAKVTGALLSDERLFKEYLVPFRRTARPPQQTEASTQEQGKAESAASKPCGHVIDESRTPLSLPSPDGASASEGAAPFSRTPLPASELPGLSPANGEMATEVGGVTEAFSKSTSRKVGDGDEDVRGEEAGEGRPPSEEPRLPSSAVKSKVTATVTEQKGPRGEGALMDVLLWNKSAVAKSMGCRGWWRHQDHWQRRLDVTKQRPRAAHLNKALQDPKYRTRLCSHWESSKGTLCPMRRRGAGKCDFAHGGIELRVRANKRDRWGRHAGAEGGGGVSLDASGGEDTLGAARSIGRIRIENGEKDGAGSALVSGARGGGGAVGTTGGSRQGKRSKSGVSQRGESGSGGSNGGVYQGRSHERGDGVKSGEPSTNLDVSGLHQSPPGRGHRLEDVAPDGEAGSFRETAVYVAADGAALQPSQLPPVSVGRDDGAYRSPVTSYHAMANGNGEALLNVAVSANGDPSRAWPRGASVEGLSPLQVLARSNGQVTEGIAGSDGRG